MAVIPETKENKLILTLDNGEKKVFEEILKKWNFKDKESLMRFMLEVLDCSKETKLFIHGEKGIEEIEPADFLINGK